MERNVFFRLVLCLATIAAGAGSLFAQTGVIQGPGTSEVTAIFPGTTHTYTYTGDDVSASDDLEWEISDFSGSTIPPFLPYTISNSSDEPLVNVTWVGAFGGTATLKLFREIPQDPFQGGPPGSNIRELIATRTIYFYEDDPIEGYIDIAGESENEILLGKNYRFRAVANSLGVTVDWELTGVGISGAINLGTGREINYSFPESKTPGAYQIKATLNGIGVNGYVIQKDLEVIYGCFEGAYLSIGSSGNEICVNDQKTLTLHSGAIDAFDWNFGSGVTLENTDLTANTFTVRFTNGGLHLIRGTPKSDQCKRSVDFSQQVQGSIESVRGDRVVCEGLSKVYNVDDVFFGNTVGWTLPSGVSIDYLNSSKTKAAITFQSLGTKNFSVGILNSGCSTVLYDFSVEVREQSTKIDNYTYDHTELSSGNASPATTELTANTCQELYGDCQTSTSQFDVYAIFSLGQDNYYTDSEDELATLTVNVSALGASNNVLFEATGIELSLNKLEPLKTYHFQLTGADAADVRTFAITPVANSYSVSQEIDAQKVSFKTYYEGLTEVDAARALLSLTNMGHLDGTFEQTFNWSVVSTEYDCLEVPGYQIQMMRIYGTTMLGDLKESDWKNATNIFSESPETNLMISVAEGTGNYVWRVRPIGTLLGETRYALSNPANWDDDSWVAGEFTFQQPDEDKNFIYSRTFVEKGRVSEQLGFANGLGQVAQQQVKIHGETDQIVATQTLQDFVGRNALSTLPVPLQNTSRFGYKNGLLSTGSSTYTKGHFDNDPQTASAAEVAGGYYSGNIPGVASAEGFPYARTLFTKDGTSRIREQSGVGATHAIKQDAAMAKTTRTYYSSVEEAELVTIFGREAPEASNVHKIITYDANNVASITYQDKGGNVIATALDAGSSAEALDKLSSDPVENNSLQQIVVSVDSEEERQNAYRTSSKKPLFFTANTSVTIDYSLTPATIEQICSQLCQTCDYKIEFYLHNQDDPNSTPERIGVHDIGPGSCANPAASVAPTINRNLSGGTNYILERRISTNQIDSQAGATYLAGHLNNIEATYTPVVDQALSALQTHLNQSTPEALYTYLDNNGYTLDEDNGQYIVPVQYTDYNSNSCSEYIFIPYYNYCEDDLTLVPDANCEVNGFTWEGYFEDYWTARGEDFGVVSEGKLPYVYFEDQYQKSIETALSETQNREPDETQFKLHYAPGQLDQMIDNLLAHNIGRLSCEDVWEVWRNEVSVYKAYDDYANNEDMNSGQEGQIPFENNMLDRFFKGLESLLGEERPEGETDICALNLYMKRDLLYGKIGTTAYPSSTTYPDLKLEAYRLVYLNTDEDDPANPDRVDLLRNLAGLSGTAAVTVTNFNQLSSCDKYKLYQLGSGFADEAPAVDTQEGRQEVINSCGQMCEDRSEEFKQAIINELFILNPNYRVENHTVTYNTALQTYVAIYDAEVNQTVFDYSICEIEVMVEGLVKNCKSNYCDLDFVTDVNGQQSLGTTAQLENLKKVFNYNFDIQIKSSDQNCGVGWDQVNTDGTFNKEDAVLQLWTAIDEGSQCNNIGQRTSSTFDKYGNVYAVLVATKGKYGYTLNNGKQIIDNSGAGRFAVVKYDPKGNYLWHEEFYFEIDNSSSGGGSTPGGGSLPGSETSLSDEQLLKDILLKVDDKGGVSFNIGIHTQSALTSTGSNLWKLRNGNELLLEFSKSSPQATYFCGDSFIYNYIGGALDASGKAKWFKKYGYPAPTSPFNTQDENGNTYLVKGTISNTVIEKVTPTGSLIWSSDQLTVGGSLSYSSSNNEYTIDNQGNIYASYQVTAVSNDVDIKINQQTEATLIAGIKTQVIVKFDANGKFIWIYTKETSATFSNLLARDGYLALIEELGSDLLVSKVYSPTNVQDKLLSGAPTLVDFSLLALPGNRILIYSDQSYSRSVGVATIDLEDFSFTSGADLIGSLDINVTDAYFDEFSVKNYIGTTGRKSLVNGYTISEGGFIAPGSIEGVASCTERPVLLMEANNGSDPSYMYNGGIDNQVYENVREVMRQNQLTAEASAPGPIGTSNAVPDDEEYLALKALYEATAGTAWTNQTGWHGGNWQDPESVTSADFAGFFGVTVEDGDVSAINLENNGLSGNLPGGMGLGAMYRLISLNLKNNNLNGAIPVNFGELVELKRLELDHNQLSSIATSWAELPQLEFLSLTNNEFTGFGSQLSSLISLSFLDLSENPLSTSLPTLPTIASLRYLDLSNLSLSGGLPSWLSSQTNLEALLLHNNGFTGSIPASFSNLDELTILSVNQNKLTGGLSNLSALVDLETLDIANNAFSGEIPAAVALLTSLENIYVQGNLFEFDDLANLQVSQMTTCQYYPQQGEITGATSNQALEYTDGIIGSPVTLSYTPETGYTADGYQWQKLNLSTYQWENVSNEVATSTYSIGSVSQADYGRYRLKMNDDDFPLLSLYSPEYAIGNGNVPKLVTPTICFQWTDERPGSIELPDDSGVWFDPVFSPACESIDMDEIRESVESQKTALILKKQTEYREAYVDKCLDPSVFAEEYTLTYSIGLHHYTLYYFDRSNNLIHTVPPEGVNTLGVSTQAQLASSKNLLPAHSYKTSYQYNSQGQLVSQQTPDAGNTDFIYNDVGQLRFSQNAQQKIDGTYSYTLYDALSRVTEVGQAIGDFENTARANRNELAWPTGGTQITRTIYNLSYPDALPVSYEQSKFLRNRISYVYLDHDGDDNTLDDRVTTIYSYDPHGNVEWLVQEMPGLGQKTIDYTYDLLSGNVLQVAYNKEEDDHFYHRYSYDADGRVELVETSHDGVIWEKDASYDYYAHGPLNAVDIGHDQVQSQDYLYTIQGWLKSINDPASAVNTQSSTTRDAFAMALHYYSGDYINTMVDIGKLSPATGRDLYNGNISAWENANQNKTGTWTRSGMQYTYDALNRIKSSAFNVHRADIGLGVDRFFSRRSFATDYTLDGNGNLLTLNRDDFDGERMDELVYNMEAGKNRLTSVLDQSGVDPDKHFGDVDGTNNYQYDAIGNLVSDVASHTNIAWTVYGKVLATENTQEAGVRTDFVYDASGNRVIKSRVDKYGLVTKDYYVRDASGNVMAIYREESAGGHSESGLYEIPVYGSDRLGTYKPEGSFGNTAGVDHTVSVDFDLAAYVGVSEYHLQSDAKLTLLPGFEFTAGVEADKFIVDQAATEPTAIENLHARELNKKAYELKDHLGNIRAVVSDTKLEAPQGEAGYMPLVISSSDYYPFGMDRTPVVWTEVEYLATFETDNEAEEIAGFQDRSQAVLSNVDLYNYTPDTPERDATNSQLLTGQSGNIFGISKFLPIQAGDKVSMEVYGLYTTTTTANPYDFSANLVGNLLNQLPLTAGELQAAGLSTSISGEFTNMGRAGLSNADGVSAYLNYLLLDENFSLVSAGYQMLPDNADLTHQQLAMELVPEQDGYVYIYLTNESQQLTDVYFDDFKITHEVLIKDPQLETYRYGFNGKEKDSKGEFGLNHYDYGFRIYNPAIAKFLSVDPLTKSYPMLTPYQFASNSPVANIDIDGLERYFTADGKYFGKYGTSDEMRIVSPDKETIARFIEFGRLYKDKIAEVPVFQGSVLFHEADSEAQKLITMKVFGMNRLKGLKGVEIEDWTRTYKDERFADADKESMIITLQAIIYYEREFLADNFFNLSQVLVHEKLHLDGIPSDPWNHFEIEITVASRKSFQKTTAGFKIYSKNVAEGYLSFMESGISQGIGRAASVGKRNEYLEEEETKAIIKRYENNVKRFNEVYGEKYKPKTWEKR